MKQHRSAYNFDGRIGWQDPTSGHVTYDFLNPEAGWHNAIPVCGQSLSSRKVASEFRTVYAPVVDIKTKQELPFPGVTPETAAHLAKCLVCRTAYEAGLDMSGEQEIPDNEMNEPEDLEAIQEFLRNPEEVIRKILGN